LTDVYTELLQSFLYHTQSEVIFSRNFAYSLALGFIYCQCEMK